MSSELSASPNPKDSGVDAQLLESFVEEQLKWSSLAIFEDDIAELFQVNSRLAHEEPHLNEDDLRKPTLLSESIDDLEVKGLKYVGGLDISFREGGDGNDAVAVLVILSYPSFQLLHTIAKVVRLKVPYVPSFLSLREAESLLELLDTARRTIPNDMPQFIFVDGNGRLHQRQAGLATVVGVRSGCPTIGIGKDYYPIMSDERVIPEIHPALSSHADAALGSQPLGATFPGNFRASQKGFKAVCRQTLKKTGDWIGIYGRDGREYVGAALLSSPDKASTNAIFVSSGHRLSLKTSIRLTLLCCPTARVPEPVRLADASGRQKARDQWGTTREQVT